MDGMRVGRDDPPRNNVGPMGQMGRERDGNGVAITRGVVGTTVVDAIPFGADDANRPKVDLNGFAKMEAHLARGNKKDRGLIRLGGFQLGVRARGSGDS